MQGVQAFFRLLGKLDRILNAPLACRFQRLKRQTISPCRIVPTLLNLLQRIWKLGSIRSVKTAVPTVLAGRLRVACRTALLLSAAARA